MARRGRNLDPPASPLHPPRTDAGCPTHWCACEEKTFSQFLLRPKAVIIMVMMIIFINVDLPYLTVRNGRGEAAGGPAVAHIHGW